MSRKAVTNRPGATRLRVQPEWRKEFTTCRTQLEIRHCINVIETRQNMFLIPTMEPFRKVSRTCIFDRCFLVFDSLYKTWRTRAESEKNLLQEQENSELKEPIWRLKNVLKQCIEWVSNENDYVENSHNTVTKSCLVYLVFGEYSEIKSNRK